MEVYRRLVPVAKALYPTWDNDKWIPSALRTFFAEARKAVTAAAAAKSP
jgi:hypothetical protein